jgi:hypothetical protein
MAKIDWKKIQEYQNENKGFLIMVADPETDAVSVSYGGLNAFFKFPMESLDKGVVFNALRESGFNDAIEPFMEGVVKSTGITPKSAGGNELLKALGGSMKSIGISKANEIRSNLKEFTSTPYKHGKTRKSNSRK